MNEMPAPFAARDFIRDIVAADLASGKHKGVGLQLNPRLEVFFSRALPKVCWGDTRNQRPVTWPSTKRLLATRRGGTASNDSKR
jgi:hypothetical protein